MAFMFVHESDLILLLMGDGQVGKSCIGRRFVEDCYSDHYSQSIFGEVDLISVSYTYYNLQHAEEGTRSVVISNCEIKLKITEHHESDIFRPGCKEPRPSVLEWPYQRSAVCGLLKLTQYLHGYMKCLPSVEIMLVTNQCT